MAPARLVQGRQTYMEAFIERLGGHGYATASELAFENRGSQAKCTLRVVEQVIVCRFDVASMLLRGSFHRIGDVNDALLERKFGHKSGLCLA